MTVRTMRLDYFKMPLRHPYKYCLGADEYVELNFGESWGFIYNFM